MEKETYITLLGEKIPIKEELKDIFELKFYKENPRIASIIQKEKQKGTEITDDFIDKELWERTGTHEVFRRIEKHGGLIHPIFVYENEVIEGNTRLCAYRHLYKKAEEEKTDKERWGYINCKILLKKLDKNQIYALLGDEHIVGKIEWNTYEKAMWMKQMVEDEGFSMEEVKMVTGLSEPTIRKYIESYKTMITEEIDDPKKFSHVEQLIGNAEISKIEKKIDPEIKRKVIKAIKAGQIKQAMDVRKVPTIWKDKASRKKFEMGEDIVQVYSELKTKIPTIEHVFIRAAEDVYSRMRNLRREEVEEIAKDNKSRYTIKQLAKESQKLNKDIGKLHTKTM